MLVNKSSLKQITMIANGIYGIFASKILYGSPTSELTP